MSWSITKYFPSRFIPSWLLTWLPGPYARLQVDQAQTSFFTGRQFRTTRRLSIPQGGSYVIKWSRTVDVVLLGLSLESSAGVIRLNVYRGGTPSAALNDVIQVFPKYELDDRPSPIYTTQSTIRGGSATFTPGEFRDAIDAVASGATAQSATVGSAISDEVALPAGADEYCVLNNDGTGTANGILRLFWEERA